MGAHSKGGKARAAALDPARRSEIARRAAKIRWSSALGGLASRGAPPVAKIIVGLRVGKPYPSSVVAKAGRVIPERRAERALFDLRAEQVGTIEAAATLRACRGRWHGGAEPSMECEFAYLPTSRETSPEVFIENMKDLAQRAAERLGQERVLLWIGDHLFEATAPGEPPPSD